MDPHPSCEGCPSEGGALAFLIGMHHLPSPTSYKSERNWENTERPFLLAKRTYQRRGTKILKEWNTLGTRKRKGWGNVNRETKTIRMVLHREVRKGKCCSGAEQRRRKGLSISDADPGKEMTQLFTRQRPLCAFRERDP